MFLVVMVSRSRVNILDLASGDFLDFPPTPKSLPRVMTVPGVISDLDGGESYDGDSDAPSSIYRERKIIVANLLPLHAQRDKEKIGGWSFSMDEDSLLLQMKDGFSSETEVIYVGCLKVDIDPSNKKKLLRNFWRILGVSQHFCPLTYRKNSIINSVSNSCGPFFITCFQLVPIMVNALTDHCGRLMYLQIKYLQIKSWK